MIEAHELTKYYDDFLAVDNVSLSVSPGTVLALLGPNGAGKTTTVRMLTSILSPSSGWARIAGYDVVQQPERVRAHVGVLTEQHGLYERMKAVEYLDFFGRVYHLPTDARRKRTYDLMERFGLTFALDKQLGDYSKGMKQKLALVRAMLHDPPVLLLDEPTSAMDPQSAKLVRDAIEELQRDDRTFMITTHNLTEAQQLADSIAIIRHGRIIASGNFDELARRFVGDPQMELRVRGELNGLAREIGDMVAVEESGANWLRYRVADPDPTNPALIQRVIGLGVEIVTLAPVSQTLEAIYLQVVKEDEHEGGTRMSTSVKPFDLLPGESQPGDVRTTLSNALIITRREVRDSFRDWRIIGPIIVLTFLFPGLAQFVAGQFASFVEGYGAAVIGTRTVPFLLMIVGFFPISISLVIALETFVGEKERRSLEPLLSTPLTNTELYIGKTLAAMLPPLLSSYGGMAVYLISLIFGDLAWRPHAMLIVQIILLTTVQALAMVTGAVVVSSQTTSTRAANLLASFIIIPMTILIQAESAIMFLAPDAESPDGIGALWAIIAGIMIVVILLLRVGNSLFNREELLGRTLDKLNLKGTAVKIWHSARAVDDGGTPARNLVDWYRRGIPFSVRRLGLSIPVTILVFVIAFVGGYLIGQIPQWQLHLPEHLPVRLLAGQIDSYTGFFFGNNPALSIAWQNGRILLGATLLATFTFGAGALILTPAVYVILGYILSQVVLAGYDPTFLIPAILTHGIVEIPVIVLATAAALHLGAVITRPPRGFTVGQAWTAALGDAVRIGLGLIVPGLLIAAVIEAYITPQVVRLVLGS